MRRGRWLLAGFGETGEWLEHGFRREIYEEVGVALPDAADVASQPWPLPCRLMVAFRAMAGDESLPADGTEIVEANSFAREVLRKYAVVTGRLVVPTRSTGSS